MIKRAFDIAAASAGLALLCPLLALIAVLVKMDSPGPILFRQERIGKGFRPFSIYKFRTMVQNASERGALVTAGDDPRITKIGRFLRKTKLDELPQLVNVLKGEMTLVGPRPEVRKYVELFHADYEEILKVRPGITDWASLKYRDEAGILGNSQQPEQEYLSRVLPEKMALAKAYVRHASFVSDLGLIFATLRKLIAN